MSDKSGIEWTDATWNPVTGCTKVSPGCDHCYAETFAERFRGVPGHHFENGFDVMLRPERIEIPLRWRKPRRIFVNSMSDLFHQDVPVGYLAEVFATMLLAPHHTFQVLTKRHARMRSHVSSETFIGLVYDYAERRAGRHLDRSVWPLPNVWLGVSVENQQWADIRIPALLDTPAAVRFLSCEPLLGPVYLRRDWFRWASMAEPMDRRIGIGWVISGGESGHGARPMHPDWARTLRDQCQAAGVPFLFKQWGEWSPNARNVPMSKHRFQYQSVRFRPTGEHYTSADVGNDETGYSAPGMESLLRVGKRSAGRELDGRTWDEYPQAVPA